MLIINHNLNIFNYYKIFYNNCIINIYLIIIISKFTNYKYYLKQNNIKS